MKYTLTTILPDNSEIHEPVECETEIEAIAIVNERLKSTLCNGIYIYLLGNNRILYNKYIDIKNNINYSGDGNIPISWSISEAAELLEKLGILVSVQSLARFLRISEKKGIMRNYFHFQRFNKNGYNSIIYESGMKIVYDYYSKKSKTFKEI